MKQSIVNLILTELSLDVMKEQERLLEITNGDYELNELLPMVHGHLNQLIAAETKLARFQQLITIPNNTSLNSTDGPDN